MAKIIDLKSRKVLADLPTDYPSPRFALPYVATDGSNLGAIAFTATEALAFISVAQGKALPNQEACPNCIPDAVTGEITCPEHAEPRMTTNTISRKIRDWFPGFGGYDPDDVA
jgi:hypothetical protein